MKTRPKEQAPESVTSGKIKELNETVIQEPLNTVVLSTVEETLNALSDAEADRLFRSGRL